MLERAQARKLLGVHKAAEGSWRHAETAAVALSEATHCLDRHHGSSAGWGMPESWRDMALRLERGDQSWSQGGSGKNAGGKGSAAKGKGKGKGKGDKGKGSESAKAKGKGKSADKGKGAGGWWPCPEPGCEKLMGKVWWNPPSICQCPQCHTYRAEAPDIWEDQREKLRAKVAKESGEEQGGEPASGDVPMFSDDEEEDLGPPVARANLTDEYKDLHVQLASPLPPKENWSAEEVMTAHTSDPGATKILLQIQECKKFLAMEALAGSFASDVDFGPAKKKLAMLEKSAARTEKSAPGAALNACQLATARQEFSDAEDAKRLVSRKGAVKASERMVRMEVICEEQVNAWTRQLKDLRESELKRAAQWEERRKLLDSRGAEVLQLFVDKIRAAKTLAAAVANVGGTSGSGASASAEVSKAAVKPDPAAVALKVKEDAAAAALKVKEDAAAEVLKEALKVSEEAFRILNKTVQFTNALPALEAEPPKDTVPVMARMFYWARASTCGEANLPFTLAEMGATPDVACSLVGRDIWDLFFGKDGGNAKDTILPMQLRFLVFQQLMRYEAKLCGSEHCFMAEHKAQEQKAVDALKAACPRLLEQRDQLKRSNPYY